MYEEPSVPVAYAEDEPSQPHVINIDDYPFPFFPKDESPAVVQPPPAASDVDTIIQNPLIRDVYHKIESIVRLHGLELVHEIGTINVFEITMRDGKMVPITVDAKNGVSSIFIGQPETKPDVVM